jgi:short-subunit dehydrogenase
MSNSSNELSPFTLITGASHGMGKAIAFECAHRGMNVLLVALPEPMLDDVVKNIREEFKIKALGFGIDLSNEDAPKQVYDFTRKENIRINILVNNAGFGAGGLFERHSLEKYYSMIRLNNSALIGLTYYFLDDLKSFPVSHMLNMSSMEATLPLPYKATYTGTKNFIYSFSLAMNEELRPHNVKITVVCPGPVVTNEEGRSRMKAQGWRAKLLVKMPDEIASIAVKAMLKGKTIVVPGTVPWLIVRVMNLFPEFLKMRILERVFRVYKDT